MFALDEKMFQHPNAHKQRAYSLLKDKKHDSCNIFLKNFFVLLFLLFSFIVYNKNTAAMTTK